MKRDEALAIVSKRHAYTPVETLAELAEGELDWANSVSKSTHCGAKERDALMLEAGRRIDAFKTLAGI